MISISSNDRYRFIDVLRTMRSIVDQLLEILNRSALNESRKLIRALNALEKRTTRPQIKLAIVGDSEALKQRLIHEFLRENLRGLGLPQTESRCLHLAFGSEPECAVTLTNGMTARLPLTELADFVGSQASTSEIQQLLVRIPNGVLKAGLVVIDTPTLGKDSNEKAPWAHSAIEHADACLLVLKDRDHLSERVTSFLREAHQQIHKYFVVVDSSEPNLEARVGREIEARSGIAAKRIFGVAFSRLQSGEGFSGEDILETLRAELMTVARISSHTAMALELHQLAQDALRYAEQARSSSKTLMLRMRLGKCVKSLASICDGTQLLQKQMVAELSKVSQSDSAALANPINSAQLTETDTGGPLASVQSGSAESTALPEWVDPARTSEALPAKDWVMQASRWQEQLQIAANGPVRVASTILPPTSMRTQEEWFHAGRASQQSSTGELADGSASETLPAGNHVLPSIAQTEAFIRAELSTDRSGGLHSPGMETPAVGERLRSPLIPNSSGPLLRTSEAMTETPEIQVRSVSELDASLDSAEFANSIAGNPPVERRFRNDEIPPEEYAKPANLFAFSGDRSEVEATEEDITVDRRSRLIRRLVATFAVVASACAITLGLQYRQPFESSEKTMASTLGSSEGDTVRSGTTTLESLSKRPSQSTVTPHDATATVAATAETGPRRDTGIEAVHEMPGRRGLAPGPIAAEPNPRNQTGIGEGAPKPSDARGSHIAAYPTGEDVIQDPLLRGVIDRWTNSYRSGNVEEQVSCYAPFVDTYFNMRNVRPEQVAIDRKKTWSKIASIQKYRVTAIRITNQGNGLESVVVQKEWSTTTTNGTKFSGSDLEKLVFLKIDNAWKIVDEVEVKTLGSKRG